jgi:hypothetical protein
MILATNPDMASTEALLHRWEVVEYIATGLVILGCAGECVADFTNIRTSEWRHGKLGKASLFVLIAGLALELVALARTNGLSGNEVATLNSETAVARQKQAEAELALERERTERQGAIEREQTDRQSAIAQLHKTQEEISRELAKAETESKGPEAALKVEALRLGQDLTYYVVANTPEEWRRVSREEYLKHVEQFRKGFYTNLGPRIEPVFAAMEAEHLDANNAKCTIPPINPNLESDPAADDMMDCASELLALSQRLP